MCSLSFFINHRKTSPGSKDSLVGNSDLGTAAVKSLSASSFTVMKYLVSVSESKTIVISPSIDTGYSFPFGVSFVVVNIIYSFRKFSIGIFDTVNSIIKNRIYIL